MISPDDDFTVVLDACVLYPQTLRDLLLRLALAGLYAARFSQRILEEARSNLVKDGKTSEHQAARIVALIREHAEECMVHHTAVLPEGFALPDPNDLHVVQTALATGAAQIVTLNLRDFPAAALAGIDLEATHPDAFLYHLCDLYPHAVAEVCRDWFSVLRDPAYDVAKLCGYLSRNRMPRAAEQLFRILS